MNFSSKENTNSKCSNLKSKISANEKSSNFKLISIEKQQSTKTSTKNKNEVFTKVKKTKIIPAGDCIKIKSSKLKSMATKSSSSSVSKDHVTITSNKSAANTNNVPLTLSIKNNNKLKVELASSSANDNKPQHVNTKVEQLPKEIVNPIGSSLGSRIYTKPDFQSLEIDSCEYLCIYYLCELKIK